MPSINIYENCSAGLTVLYADRGHSKDNETICWKLLLIRIGQKRWQISLYRSEFYFCIPASLNLGTVITQSTPVITSLKGPKTLCRY